MTTNHINLLDPDSSSIGQTEIDYQLILIALIALILVCLGFAGWQKYNLSLVEDDLAQITAKVSALKDTTNSTRKTALSSETISKTTRPISWANVLKKITHITPSSIYITQLTGSITGNRQLVLMGNSHTLSAIFALKESLSKLPDCGKTSISSLNRATFQIECQIK